MPRILKRPMFSRGGSTNKNDGIMTGLVDRTNLAKGSPKFDTGKMKEDASSILSKIVKLLPGGKIGEAAAQAAGMAKGNEAEIIKAIEKILMWTPAGQVGAALKFLADRYRIDPAIVERIAKSKMADANIQTDPSGSADEGFPSRPEFESSAEDTSVMPRTNRFDKFKGSISDKELNEFYDRDELDKLYENIKPVPMPGFEKPPLSPDATTLNPHQDINPMQTMEFRDSNGNGIEDRSEGIYLDRDIIPYDPDREFKSLRNSDMFKKYRDNIEFNQGGSVNYNQGIMRTTAARGGRIGYAEGPTQAEIYAKEYYDQLSKIQPPKSRLNLGKVGLNLAAGKYSGGDLISTLAGAGSDIYDDYTAKDDVRRNLDYKTKMASAKMGISKADAEAIAKAKALATASKVTTKGAYNKATGETGYYTNDQILSSGGNLVPIPQGQSMSFNTKTGVFEMTPTGAFNQNLKNEDKAKKLGTQYQILEGFISDMKLRLPETKTSATGVGFAIVEGISDQVSQIAESLGVKDTLVIEDEEKLDNYLSSKGFTEGAISYQTMKGSAINLGYALAKIAEPDNPRLSEGDIIRQLNRINFGGSREVFAASLDQVLKEEGIRAKFEMKGLGGDLSVFDEKEKKEKKEFKKGEDGIWRFE